MTVPLGWSEHLAVLEEWLRQADRVLAATTLEPLSPPVSTPVGPLPEDLRIRAAVVQQRLAALQERAALRARQLEQSRAYTFG